MMRRLLFALILACQGCGRTLTEPVPCTPETARETVFDHQGRLVMYACF